MKASGLEGKVALVTAGTAGVGLKVAEELCEGGATVFVNGRTAEGGEAALRRLMPISDKARFLPGDVSDYSSIVSLVDVNKVEHGRLDILVSAGAPGSPGPMPFESMSAEEIVRGFSTRLFPRIFPVHAAIPALRASEAASVVLLTTDAARHVTPGEAIVGATGAAVMLLTKSLARELSRYRIRVNAVAMTITSDTPSWDRIFAAETFQEKVFSKAVARFPFGRPPTATEVASVATFLASPAAGQVTGQTISVNGGLSSGGW